MPCVQVERVKNIFINLRMKWGKVQLEICDMRNILTGFL